MKTDQYTKDFEKFYKKLKAKQVKQKAIIDKEYSEFAKTWIAENSPYKVGDVLEVVDNKKMKLQRMVIYDLGIQIFDTCPILNAYGWWIDGSNNPVKWNGSGYPLLNCTTSYKMTLSDNQLNNPVQP
jgi:hypothetical protein